MSEPRVIRLTMEVIDVHAERSFTLHDRPCDRVRVTLSGERQPDKYGRPTLILDATHLGYEPKLGDEMTVAITLP